VQELDTLGGRDGAAAGGGGASRPLSRKTAAMIASVASASSASCARAGPQLRGAQRRAAGGGARGGQMLAERFDADNHGGVHSDMHGDTYSVMRGMHGALTCLRPPRRCSYSARWIQSPTPIVRAAPASARVLITRFRTCSVRAPQRRARAHLGRDVSG
jgi:hypothetical protein